MENVRAYVPKTGYGTGYHGYWVQNYYRVNEHFGDWNNVDQLSRELRKRGMRYMQDITLNHSNPLDNHVYGRLYETDTPGQIFINSYKDDEDMVSGQRSTNITKTARHARRRKKSPTMTGRTGSYTTACWLTSAATTSTIRPLQIT